ncbi:MAG: hemerythrin domain-containing protein [Proteobacteria bacterium]|nr:hemerythrin domain-containing protein [Pseudomonadota bacterium]HQR03169.1 hemerythrin domain-containing protein [Rhodocyclaceae bacterium]
MSLIHWKPEFELGLAPMDDTHREFIDRLDRLDQCPDADFLSELDAFIEHTRHHFEQEWDWMRGSMFPPLNCHHSEHDNVLDLMLQVRADVARGDIPLGRTLVKELLPWFENHAATMDTALASWIGQTGYPAEARKVA